MQGIKGKPLLVGNDLPAILSGVTFAISGTGVTLALADADSPLRAPFVLFFLFVGPASGLYAALRGLEFTTRATTAAAGAVAIDLAVAGALSPLNTPTANGGVAAIVVVTALLFLWAVGGRRNGRTLSTRRPDRVAGPLREEETDDASPLDRP
ncbi:hypothetical protein ACIBCM_15940 [Streptomyces sp. NPDC051018]|uniref:hypothetical protein n=1 Tax=Streptomyces sp. NPDC051018 TaxID=3365639 RepID=UPI0037B5A782